MDERHFDGGKAPHVGAGAIMSGFKIGDLVRISGREIAAAGQILGIIVAWETHECEVEDWAVCARVHWLGVDGTAIAVMNLTSLKRAQNA